MNKNITSLNLLWILLLATTSLSMADEYRVQNLTNNANSVWYTQLNNIGQVAWQENFGDGGFFEIVLYDDGVAERITNNTWWDHFGCCGRLNDVGQIVWLGEPVSYYGGGSQEIC